MTVQERLAGMSNSKAESDVWWPGCAAILVVEYSNPFMETVANLMKVLIPYWPDSVILPAYYDRLVNSDKDDYLWIWPAAQELWLVSRRRPDDPSITAVSQLLYGLAAFYKFGDQGKARHGLDAMIAILGTKSNAPDECYTAIETVIKSSVSVA